MDFLWSPWRSKYIDSFKDESNPDNCDCFFCEAISNNSDDKAKLVLKRKDNCIVMLNKFPYTSGHLLIAPLRHIGNYTEMTDEELNEISLTIRDCIAVLETAFGPQGYNIGVNVGNVAGAGVPGHIHWHIVPRWAGDKNFMYVTGETNVISFSNEDVYEKLKKLSNKKRQS
jgi:ATP adenylyltransferase